MLYLYNPIRKFPEKSVYQWCQRTSGSRKLTYISRSIKRFEDARLITGNGLFIHDMKLPDMLHAVVRRSVHAHARIRSIDVSTALELEGIVEVCRHSAIMGHF